MLLLRNFWDAISESENLLIGLPDRFCGPAVAMYGNWRDGAHKPVVPDMPPVRRWLDAGYRAAYRVAFPMARRWWAWRGHGGAAIIVWLDNRVLTVLHSYKPGLRLPGGGVKTGEDHSAAAVRELREETGVVIPQAHLRLLLTYRGRYGMRSIFEARIDHEPTLRVDQREIVYAGFNAPEDVTEYNRTVKGYLSERRDRPADKV